MNYFRGISEPLYVIAAFEEVDDLLLGWNGFTFCMVLFDLHE
jgi:hypothetical protein